MRKVLLLALLASPVFAEPFFFPDPTGCIAMACSQIGFECRNPRNLQIVAHACQGNTGGSCLATACSFAPPFACSRLDRVIPFALACRGNYGDHCFRQVCEQLLPMSCRKSARILEILRDCAVF